MTQTSRDLLILSCTCLLLFIPFSDKPFHIDSPVTIYMAQQLLENPLNPPLGEYGKLLSEWNHTELSEESAFHATPHPPLIALWTALFIRIGGTGERLLNWAFFPFYLGSVLLFYGLCQIIVRKSCFFAALLFAVSPALVVNAQNCMYDVPLASFCIGTFYFMFRKNNAWNVLFAGIFAGLACLTKFTGGTLIIAGTVWYLTQRRYRDLVLFLCISGLFNGIWLIHNLLFFDGWLLTRNGHAAYVIGDLRYRFERLISYTGGSVLLPVFPLLLWWKSTSIRTTGIGIGVLSGIWSILLITVLKYSVCSAGIYWICSFAGGIVLLQFASGIRTMNNSLRYRVLGIHAGLQIAGGLFLTLYAVRYALTFLFLVPIVIAAGSEQYLQGTSRRIFRLSAILLTCVITVLLSIGDYSLVSAEKKIAEDIPLKYPGKTILYRGRLGYLYYMHNAGAVSLSENDSLIRSGSLFIRNSFYIDDMNIVNQLNDRLTLIDSLSYPLFPVRTIGGRAGFYGNDRLPFAWQSPSKDRVFYVYTISD